MKSNTTPLSKQLDQIEQQLSDEQRQAIAARRQLAIDSMSPQRTPWYVASGLAASLALVSIVWLPMGSSVEQPMVADKDLVENLEFYAWLAEQPSDAVNQ